MRPALIPVILSLLVFVASCKNDDLKIDTSNIDVEIKILRFDMELFQVNQQNTWDEIHKLSSKYTPFWDLYTYQILNVGGTNDKDFADRLLQFINDPVILKSFEESQQLYNSSEYLQNELTGAFKHFHHYFPEMTIPEVITFIGGFNQSVVTDSALLGIGLDKYLGSNSKFYRQLGYPVFARKQLNKENIAIDCMRAWAAMEFPYNDSVDNLLNKMIYFGRQLHFVKAMMPEIHDSLLMRYSKKSLAYCNKYEKEMYSYLIENQLLYSSKLKNIIRFTKDGPFTSGFKNSPARVGNWIGWQIVKRYLENNPDIGLKELMQTSDYQKIFVSAKYNP